MTLIVLGEEDPAVRADMHGAAQAGEREGRYTFWRMGRGKQPCVVALRHGSSLMVCCALLVHVSFTLCLRKPPDSQKKKHMYVPLQRSLVTTSLSYLPPKPKHSLRLDIGKWYKH